MDKLISNALNGQKKQLESLFSANVKECFYPALLLLGSEKKADSAVKHAFKDALTQMQNGHVQTESDFSKTMLQKLLGFCKRNILADNNKAFQEGSKALTVEELSVGNTGSDAENVVSALPPLQRFIFVLKNVTGMSDTDVSSFLKVDKKVIAETEAKQSENLALCLSACGLSDKFNVDSLLKTISDNKTSDLLNGSDKNISEIIAPLVSRAGKKSSGNNWLLISVIIILLIAIGLIIAAIVHNLNKNNTFTTSTSKSAASSKSDTASTDGYTRSGASEVTPTHYADIDIKDYGTITVALDENIAPITVQNFVSLAESGFYNGLTFHRIMEGFMMQGGDPLGTGSGGSDKEIKGEFSSNGIVNNLSHTRGVISMARATPPDSASSQFFICHEDSTFLDGNYAAFGIVTEGLDVVDKVCTEAKPTDNNGTIPKDQQPVINSITIRKAD